MQDHSYVLWRTVQSISRGNGSQYSLCKVITVLSILPVHLSNWRDRQGKKNRDLAGEDAGLSGRQVQRYLNLNDLNQGFLDMVDDKKIQMGLGLEIASMRPEVQQWIFDFVEMGSVINSDIISKLKRVDETEGLDEEVINCILNEQEQKPKCRKITLSERKLNKYFSEIYTIEEIESILYNLLDQWKRTMEGEHSDE